VSCFDSNGYLDSEEDENEETRIGRRRGGE
jgi:hypothetical protein